MKRYLVGGTPPVSFMADAMVSAARVAVGLALALAHGYGKIPPPERFITGVGELGFPAPEVFAWLAAAAEFGGGICLALGLFTRPAAFFAGFTVMIALFVRHAADEFAIKELAFLYLSVCVIFFALGSGRFGLDRFFRGGSGAGQKSTARSKGR
jgi:putative oxidoreductase